MAGPSARRARTSLRLRALDARDRLSGRSGRLIPPRRLQFVGEGDFVGIGDEFLSHLVALCGLRAEDRVLDVGCGIGRLARPLAGYLSIDGAYAGFDVNAAGIRWCTQRYGHFPQFSFAHADVRNARYNPGVALDQPAGQTGWLTIGAVVLALFFGSTVLMASLAFSFQRFFENQIEEGRKISQ